MLDRLLESLVASQNEAADDCLLEALRLGSASEQHRALDALLRRKTPTGAFGMLRAFESWSHELRLTFLQRCGELYHLLPDAGRHDDTGLRVAAMKAIALGRIGKLSYVLTENLHHPDETVSGAAVDALVSLSRHIASETRRLQSGKLEADERHTECKRLLDIRPDIEAAVFRGLDVHKGTKSSELLRAALLLADHPGSKTLAVLSTSRHGGVSPMVKRLQQAPDAEHVDAFLLGATHGQLRSQYSLAFAHIENGPALDALLRRSHYLKDSRLELCMRQVTRGAWWSDASLAKDLARRDAAENARIADWIGSSGTHDVVQDERLTRVHEAVNGDLSARLRLLRTVLRRPRGASLTLVRRFLDDTDETLQRIAAREIVRRKPADQSTVLLGLMKTGPISVRRVASRAISAGAFDNYYDRFDKLDAETRVRAGKAVLKLLPDAIHRLRRKLITGPVDDRLKGLQVVQELGVADTVREAILPLVVHENPRLRSKAVAVVGTTTEGIPEELLEKALADSDARVRANAIEVLESRSRQDYVSLLAGRVRSSDNRERANAIKALHALKVSAAAPQLLLMLRDGRSEHRISAMWAARHMGVYRLLEEIAQLARTEDDPKVRRYALASIRVAAEKVRKSGVAPRQSAATTAELSVPHTPATSGVARVLSPSDPAALSAQPVDFKSTPAAPPAPPAPPAPTPTQRKSA
jgi:HEAT repeat protein